MNLENVMGIEISQTPRGQALYGSTHEVPRNIQVLRQRRWENAHKGLPGSIGELLFNVYRV